MKDGSYKVQRPFVLVTVEGKALSPVAQAFFDYATSPMQRPLLPRPVRLPPTDGGRKGGALPLGRRLFRYAMTKGA